ncbi:MAG: carbohydrate kinase family protein [Candidatus Paceibacterota bacterium]
MKNIDILAIGDIATDVFIKIKDAEENCDLQGEHCKLCLSFGSKIPYESAEECFAVGNSSNVAVSASRLGLKSALMANIGDDQNGINCLDVLKKEKVDTTFIKKELEKLTNYHYVLWYEKEHTILTKHEKYKYEWTKTKESEEYHSPAWIYLSSLGENSLPFHNEIMDYLKRHTKVKLAFQPGTFQIKLGADALKDIYQRTNVFLCNHNEAQRILKTKEKDIQKLMSGIYDLGPKIVVITDDADGAYSYDGKEVLFMKSFPITPVESTGAGDAFSGAFITALSLGKEIKNALVWGTANAASVMMYVGPHKGLLNRDEIEEYIKNAPVDCNPVKLN